MAEDYEDIWRWICEEAEAWQARWLDEDRRLFSPAEAHLAQKRAGQAFQRRIIQTCDLATCINQGDTGAYIRRWYFPETRDYGVKWRAIHTDEVELTDFGVIKDLDDATAVRWGDWGYTSQPGKPQASQAPRLFIPAWNKGLHRVGRRPRLWQRAHEFYRHCRELRRKWQSQRH